MEEAKESYFPLFVPIRNKKIRIYGGGKIAARRVDTLLEFGAAIEVIAPKVEKKLEDYANEGKIIWKRAVYQEGSIDKDSFMVLAATSDYSVNEMVYQEAKQKQLLVNNAAKKEECDFFFPALIKEKNMVLGLTASGMDHKLTRKVAAKLRGVFKQIIKESENK